MLPDIRFAIGAVLAGALLIVSAFGMAATVRVAHHRAVGPLEGSRILVYDPLDWVPRPAMTRRVADAEINTAGVETLVERVAATPPDPDVTQLSGGTGDRESLDDGVSSEVAQPAELIAPSRGAPADANIPTIPATTVAELEDARPAEADRVERVAALPAAPGESTTAEPSAEQSQAAAPPVAIKELPAAAKKQVAKKRRLPARPRVQPPTAMTGYPVTEDITSFGGLFFFDGSSTTATKRTPATCAVDAWHCR